MSLVDFEILLFKINTDKQFLDSIYTQLSDLTKNLGYVCCVVDAGVTWTEEMLLQLFTSLTQIEVNEEMVKNKKKKMILFQSRGFLPEDLKIIRKKIGEVLINYDINIFITDESIKLEKADTFFNRVAKHLKIYNEIKERKKKKLSEELDNGE